MKTRTVLFSAAAVLLVVLVVPFAFAQRGRGMHEHGDMMMFGHLQKAKDALGLSDQQMTDIKAIFQQLHDQNAQYRQQVHGGMQQIMQTLVKNPNDLAQEAFVRAFQTIGRFKTGEPFGPWIYRIVTNLALDVVKRRQRFRHEELSDAQPAERRDRADLPAVTGELGRRIDEAIESLP